MTGNDRRRLTRAERRADDAGTVMNAGVLGCRVGLRGVFGGRARGAGRMGSADMSDAVKCNTCGANDWRVDGMWMTCRPCEADRQSLSVLIPPAAPPAPRVPAPHEMAPFTIADAVAGLVLPRGAHFEWDTPLASDLERNAAAQRLAALESEHAALTDAANAAVAYISGLHSSQRDRRAVDVMNQLMRALRPGRDVK